MVIMSYQLFCRSADGKVVPDRQSFHLRGWLGDSRQVVMVTNWQGGVGYPTRNTPGGLPSWIPVNSSLKTCLTHHFRIRGSPPSTTESPLRRIHSASSTSSLHCVKRVYVPDSVLRTHGSRFPLPCFPI